MAKRDADGYEIVKGRGFDTAGRDPMPLSPAARLREKTGRPTTTPFGKVWNFEDGSYVAKNTRTGDIIEGTLKGSKAAEPPTRLIGKPFINKSKRAYKPRKI